MHKHDSRLKKESSLDAVRRSLTNQGPNLPRYLHSRVKIGAHVASVYVSKHKEKRLCLQQAYKRLMRCHIQSDPLIWNDDVCGHSFHKQFSKRINVTTSQNTCTDKLQNSRSFLRKTVRCSVMAFAVYLPLSLLQVHVQRSCSWPWISMFKYSMRGPTVSSKMRLSFSWQRAFHRKDLCLWQPWKRQKYENLHLGLHYFIKQ